MTASSGSFELTQNSVGLRFTAPEAETAYRTWRNEQSVPVIRLAGFVSLIAWIFIPVQGYLWRPDIAWFEIWWLGYVLVIPVFLLAILMSYTGARRYSTVSGCIGLAVAGSAQLWILIHNMQSILNAHTAGVTVAVMVITASFALFMRLPPVLAAAAIAPFMLPTMALLLQRFASGSLPTEAAYPFTSIVGTTCFFVGVMSIVGERFFRRAFINEQIVAWQNMSLKRSRDLIRRYVPPALADQIIDGQLDGIEAPKRRRVTVLFSDIVGFTAIADRVEPEVMTQVVSDYMATMAAIVDAHKGTVNEFIGDGLMALFGAPNAAAPEEQARGAVFAAQAMQAKLPELNESWRKLGLGAPLQIRIGINTGMVSVGSYGSEGRMTYTAIGLQTNIAARIQSHCEPGRILLSDATWQLIRDEIECAPLGQVECKGVHFPIGIYSPVDAQQSVSGEVPAARGLT